MRSRPLTSATGRDARARCFLSTSAPGRGGRRPAHNPRQAEMGSPLPTHIHYAGRACCASRPAAWRVSLQHCRATSANGNSPANFSQRKLSNHAVSSALAASSLRQRCSIPVSVLLKVSDRSEVQHSPGFDVTVRSWVRPPRTHCTPVFFSLRQHFQRPFMVPPIRSSLGRARSVLPTGPPYHKSALASSISASSWGPPQPRGALRFGPLTVALAGDSESA